MTRIPLEELRQVLVIRTDHIGDLVCSTPFLRALRERLPQARIRALLPPYTRDVLAGGGLVDEVLTLEPTRPERALAGSPPDLAISLAPRSQSLKLAWRTRARYRAGCVYATRPLARLAARAWLTHQVVLPGDRDLKAGQRVPHEVEQLGRLARALGLPYEDPRLELTLDEEARRFGAGLVAGWGPTPVALHLARGWITGGWQLSNLTRLIEGLLWAGGGAGVLVTYGPAEEALACQLTEALARCGLLRPGQEEPRAAPPGEGPIRLVGGVDFPRWAAALAACRCLVSPDTGAVHVGAAVGTPVVALFERETARLCQQQWYPWGVPHRLVTKGPAVETQAAILRGVEELLTSP